MILPTVFFAALSLLAALAGLNRFIALTSQPSPLFALVEIIAIWIPISIVFLLPIDILSSNSTAEERNIFFLNPKYILFFWKFDYWSAFILMWALLPLVQEYYRSGEFSKMDKIKDSVKSNLKFQLIVGSVGAVGLVYFFLRFGFNFQTFKDLLIALSHTYSLILSLWLMSHGLISIPRRLWLANFNLEHHLETLYSEIPKIYDELNESTYNYKDICSIINSLNSIPGVEESIFRAQVQYLHSQVPLDLDLRHHVRTAQYTSLQQLTPSILSKLHRTLKAEVTNYKSAVYEFNKAKMNISRLQDIVDSKSQSDRSLKFKYGSSFIKNGRLNYLIHAIMIPVCNLLLSVLLFLFSFLVIESEVLHSTRFSIMNSLLITDNLNATIKFICSAIILAYMVLCSLISLTRIKLFKMYHLFPKDSNPVSVVFFTMYSNRLTVPLSYNFLTLLQEGKIHSQFNDFLGSSINLSVLGGFLNSTLPRLIVLPILLTYFNVFDKLKKKFWFDEYFDALGSDEEGSDPSLARKANMIREGKLIIQREIGSVPTASSRLGRISPLYDDEDQTDPLINIQVSKPNVFDKVSDWFSAGSQSSGNAEGSGDILSS